MDIALFGAKSYDRHYFKQINKKFNHKISYIEATLQAITTPLAKGYAAVCVFVNDTLDKPTLQILAEGGTRIIALRCAGYNNVDLAAAEALGMTVVRVPEYSPHGVAEHAVALILALNRKIYKSYNRVRENNFSLEGLLGFNMFDKTVGVIGTGKIGAVFSRIMLGFRCRVIACDRYPNADLKNDGIAYVELDTLLEQSDIISLHCPLTPETYHLIDQKAISKMKNGVMLINTSRGALIDTINIISGLKSGKIGYLGLDVYEEEADLFFEDISDKILKDDIFARLLTFPNVVITGHQAFFTSTALENIAETTLSNISQLEKGLKSNNVVFSHAVSEKHK
jgi:D-lactate dehydrogenase